MKDSTPSSERLHIAFVGRRNAGKSSLVNMLAGQAVSIVSDIPGTTTDPVRKALEIPGLGPCVLLDTAGLDDEGALGSLRSSAANRLIPVSDVVVLVVDGSVEDGLDLEKDVIARLKDAGTPFVVALNKTDKGVAAKNVVTGVRTVPVSALDGTGKDGLVKAILDKVPQDFGSRSLLGGMVSHGDRVILVMPQDSEAPKGRLIMPQTMAIRELLDGGCISLSCTPDSLKQALESFREAPELIIADSSVFKAVAPLVPEGTKLTSFSILMAAYKGDLDYFVKSASAIGTLSPGDRVLIAESCSHIPDGEDIGRVKIPSMLRPGLNIEIVSGHDFPEDLTRYSLIIHCGGCVFSRRHLMSRVEKAKHQGVPMTNYGVALAYLTGILGKVSLPG